MLSNGIQIINYKPFIKPQSKDKDVDINMLKIKLPIIKAVVI